MGYSSYSTSNAENTRSISHTYTNSVDQNFTQNVKKTAHASMKSQGITTRVARDSEAHPNSYPIIIALDLTGSMQQIPQNLIKTGLPTIISNAIQGGVQSPALLFLGVGDHEIDDEPLQVGQFESGDEELDLWLGRTYLEQGGGSNEGESYSLAHYFAAKHCITDHWQKRAQKGLLITIGDEPSLKSYPTRALKEVMGTSLQGLGFTDKEILVEAQEQWEVYHINPRDNGKASMGGWRDTKGYWSELLGQNYLGTDDYENIPDMISKLILQHGIATDIPSITPTVIKDGTVVPGDDKTWSDGTIT